METIAGQMVRGNVINAAKLPIIMTLAASFYTGGYTAHVAARAWRSVSSGGPLVFGRVAKRGGNKNQQQQHQDYTIRSILLW